jgi:hypothetical protein
MSAIAKLLKDGETARGIEAFSRSSVAHGSPEWTSEDVRAGAGLRLYRATADSTGSSPRTPGPITAFPCRRSPDLVRIRRSASSTRRTTISARRR